MYLTSKILWAPIGTKTFIRDEYGSGLISSMPFVVDTFPDRLCYYSDT